MKEEILLNNQRRNLMECTVYLTDSCNLRCNYCYQGDTKNSSFLSREKMRDIIKYIFNTNIEEKIYLTFLGGEPLLNKKRLYEAVDLIKTEYLEYKEMFEFSITTNGILLKDKDIDFFEGNNFKISISLDGNRETNELNRSSLNGKDTYSIITEHLKKLVDRDYNFSVRMTVTANNVHLFYTNILYFYNMGIKKINCAFDHFGDWEEEQIKELDRQFKLVDDFYLDVLSDHNNDFLINIYDFKFTTFLVKQEPLFCSAGSIGHLTINSKGELFPCGFVTNNSVWQVGDVLSGLDRKKFISTARGCVSKNEKCENCDIAFTCSGRKCGFQNYSITGYLNITGDIACKLERLLFEHDYYVISCLYKAKHPRIMELIDTALEYKCELNPYMERIMLQDEAV